MSGRRMRWMAMVVCGAAAAAVILAASRHFREKLAAEQRLAALRPLGPPVPEFSAQVVHLQQSMRYRAPFYLKGRRVCTEVSTATGRARVILDVVKRSAVLVFPEQRGYAEIPVSGAGAMFLRTDDDFARIGARRELLGTEKMGLYPCRKYRITFREKESGIITQWYSEDLHCPLRTEIQGPSGSIVQDLMDIKEGPVDDRIFAIPEGFKKVPMPPSAVLGRPPATNAPLPRTAP